MQRVWEPCVQEKSRQDSIHIGDRRRDFSWERSEDSRLAADLPMILYFMIL